MKRKCFVAILMLLALCVTLVPQRVQAAERTMDVGYGLTISEGEKYSFMNVSSGWNMNVKGAGKKNGTHVNLWPFDMSEPNTQCFTFTFTSIEKKTLLISPICAPGMYLDVRRNNKPLAPAQKMCIWEQDGDPIKEIIIEPLADGSCYLTLAANKDYCIGAASATAAKTKQKQLEVCKKTDAEEQRWFLCDESGQVIDFCNDTVYESTVAMLDTLLNELNETKNVFGESKYLSYKKYCSVYLPELITDVEMMRERVIKLYEKASLSEDADCSYILKSIRVWYDETKDDIRKLQNYRNTITHISIGGSSLRASINEVISWFEWLADIGSITEEIIDEAYLTDAELQSRMEELVEKLRDANKKAPNNENAKFAYFTTTGKELRKDVADECYNGNVIKQKWFTDVFGVVYAKQFPAHLATINAGDANTGYSCFGFGAFAQWYVYKENNSDWIMSTRVETGNYTKEFLTGTNAATGEPNLQVGDIIRIHISKNGKSYYHTMIFHSFTTNGLKVLDCNLNSDNKVCIEEVTYAREQWDKDPVWIYRVK